MSFSWKMNVSKLFICTTATSIAFYRAGGVSQIHNWVRPVRYHLRNKRKAEYVRYPEREKPARRSSFSDWNYRSEILAFGSRLQENFNENLITQAFIDESYVHQEKEKEIELGLSPSTIVFTGNRGMAERGENFMRKTLRAFLMKELPKLPQQGVESVVDRLMSPEILENISSNLGTKDLILSAEYPPSQETFVTSLKAIVAALEESSGEERAEKFVVDFVASHLCGKDIHDFWEISKPWHLLLDMTKPQGILLEPRLLRESGRHTLLSAFVVGIYDEQKRLLGTGFGESIDIAQEMAALDVIRGIVGTRTPSQPFKFQSTNFPIQLIPQVRA